MQKREKIRLPIGDNLPNIYLLGFMGTGKTSVGKRLARRLNFTFIDSDSEIERQQATEIKEIFSQYGEAKFRQLEREFIESGHPKNNCVVSCGGGLVCRDDMPELVKSKGVAIVLFSQPNEILERTSKNNRRPLLNVENPLERINELLKERTPYYLRSGVSIATDKDINKTVEHVLRIYLRKIKTKK
ncbi:MAG: shikimate kinase [Verrucomicrobiaceae bacterium]|nr:shikimate kinase [Verrucomicrobiaceae bacterium]